MRTLQNHSSGPFVHAAIRRLIERQGEFLRFFRKRMRRSEDAEDAFQDLCLKVIRAAETPEDEQKIDAWLTKVRSNTLIDHYRRRAARQRAEAAYEREPPEVIVPSDPEPFEQPCGCVGDLVKTLPADYAEIIRRVDIAEEPRERIAEDLGLTMNNISVRLHRARRRLKIKIERNCHACCGASSRTCDCRWTGFRQDEPIQVSQACNAHTVGASM